MRALSRKVWRDLWRLRAQALAVGLVLATAVTALIGAMGTYRCLVQSRDRFYDTHRFGEIFAHLRRAPDRVAQRLTARPGVLQLDARILELVTLELDGEDRSGAATLISLPEQQPAPLNRVLLRAGRMPAPGVAYEALANEAFAQANHIQPGDSVTALLGGQRQRLRIVGVALSPETIYAVRPGELMPDDAHYGFFWLRVTQLAPALDMEGAFNDLVLRLAPGASAEDVMRHADRALAPYGGLGAYRRDDHVSHRFLSDDIGQLGALALLLPAVFFMVAAYLLNMVLSRLVTTQRAQIAVLKALGYTSGSVGLHYLAWVTMLVLAAVVVGSAGSLGVATLLSRFYAQDLYRLPTLITDTQTGTIALACFFSLASAYLGVVGSARRAVRLPPAEAMRPPAPASFKPSVLERLGLAVFLPPVGRMVLRSIGRRPWRVLASSLGIASAIAILVGAGFFTESIERLLDLGFKRGQRQDVTVVFSGPRSLAAVRELRQIPEVLAGLAEGEQVVVYPGDEIVDTVALAPFPDRGAPAAQGGGE